MLNKGVIEYNDNHSINIGGDVLDAGASKETINIGGGVGGNVLGAGANKETYKNNTIYQRQNEIGITAADWMDLEKYFIMRQKEFPVGDRNYEICRNLITYTQKKDASKIKEYLHKIGKEAIKMIFTASTNVAAMETVKPILQKILSLN